jgi:hypothetical protein
VQEGRKMEGLYFDSRRMARVGASSLRAGEDVQSRDEGDCEADQAEGIQKVKIGERGKEVLSRMNEQIAKSVALEHF